MAWIEGKAKAVVDAEEAFVSEVTEEMKEALADLRGKASAKKPRAARKKVKVGKEYRATFIVDIDIVRKVKYIAIADTRLLKEVIADALTAYIAKWERKNYPIRLPKVKRDS